MIDFRTTATLLGSLGLALAVLAAPAEAKMRAQHHPGYEARAQAVGEGAEMPTAPARAQALRECNEKVASKKHYTWGEEQDLGYRACMAQHGLPE